MIAVHFRCQTCHGREIGDHTMTTTTKGYVDKLIIEVSCADCGEQQRLTYELADTEVTEPGEVDDWRDHPSLTVGERNPSLR